MIAAGTVDSSGKNAVRSDRRAKDLVLPRITGNPKLGPRQKSAGEMSGVYRTPSFSDQVRRKTGRLGVSIKALRIGTSSLDLQSLPKELVPYCARHDYGTRILVRTGNLAAVMRTMGHRDVKTAMHYQHPELEIVRAALDYRPTNTEAAA
jgi:integrase